MSEAVAQEKIGNFKSGLEILDYLKSEGWKISKSKLYNDISGGLIRREKDGSFTRSSVDAYAKRFLLKLDGSNKVKQSISVRDIKQLQAEILEMKKEKLRWEMELESGKYIERSEVEAMLAARAARFKSDLISFVYREIPEVCIILDGNDEKIGKAIDHCLKRIYDILRSYAGDS